MKLTDEPIEVLYTIQWHHPDGTQKWPQTPQPLPFYEADLMRRINERNSDWTGKLVPWERYLEEVGLGTN